MPLLGMEQGSMAGNKRYCLHDTCSVTTQLHLAAITSMKGELNELKTRLHHVTRERDLLERQVNMTQSDTLCSQREVEARVEQVAARYEERIIELHSVIAELRKKMERHHINVIREEEEFEESDAAQSNRSQDGGSNHDNLGDSHSASLGLGNELSLELSRVVTEMESAMAKHAPLVSQLEEDGQGKELTAQNITKKAQEEVAEYEEEEEESKPPTPPPRQAVSSSGLGCSGHTAPGGPQVHNDLLTQRDAELTSLRSQLTSLRAERDTLHKRVWELQTRAKSAEGHCSPVSSPSPTTARPHYPAFPIDRLAGAEQLPVAKVAGLKKLRTLTGDRHALGAEISSLGLPTTQTAEHLVQSFQVNSSAQELAHTLNSDPSTSDLDPRLVEYRLELDRVQSRADHLRAQNDTLALTLSESKAHAERMSSLVGKYESNATALTLALSYSDQALEACQGLISLLDSEISVLLANCRAAGIGGFGVDTGEDDQGEVTALLQQSHGSRRTAESMARRLLHRLDRNHVSHTLLCSPSPWEDVSSLSHTTSTTSSTDSGGGEGELGKGEEQRLRDYVLQLRAKRVAVRATTMELEPLHVDPWLSDTGRHLDVTRLDLENAVLMQELMAMKEERAELKAAHYLLEKESRAQELRLAAHDSTEAAFRVTIKHLRSELHQRTGGAQEVDSEVIPVTIADLPSNDPAQLASDLAAALTRERSLKCRVHELVATLEKISRNSEVRHKQSAEFVNDLKRANSALITAFDKAKKRYQGKLKKLELQLKSVSERYETQIHIMKQRLSMFEDESCRPPPSETSL
ncbi:colorectal mutant cancer protein-like isoform X2 [Littorina saxatilis]|uniref:Harmonin-binding protein USHBP1 PDZ-binding domain-containing protein n=1 Tax=Littorina saxatilis TaxID=31220 RepID=A0AAN9G5M6_9CAEN